MWSIIKNIVKIIIFFIINAILYSYVKKGLNNIRSIKKYYI